LAQGTPPKKVFMLHPDVMVAGRQVKRHPVVNFFHVGIGASPEKLLHRGLVAVHGGQVKRRLAEEMIIPVGVGTGLGKPLPHGFMTLFACLVRCRTSMIAILFVYIYYASLGSCASTSLSPK
jgi:hypothetical protein